MLFEGQASHDPTADSVSIAAMTAHYFTRSSPGSHFHYCQFLCSILRLSSVGVVQGVHLRIRQQVTQQIKADLY